MHLSQGYRLFSCAILLVACQTRLEGGRAEPSALPGPSLEPAPKAAPEVEHRIRVERFGAPVPAGEPVLLAAVLANPDEFSGKSVLVEGEVKRTCTRKGCWMEVGVSRGTESQACRVTFQDYGFFVPTNAAGSHARMAASVEVKTVRAAEVAHLESEGARFATKLPDGSAREVQLVATGVELTRGS